ncbi:MAG: DUF2796 domain-containing protein [Pseudomonadota bacterium]
MTLSQKLNAALAPMPAADGTAYARSTLSVNLSVMAAMAGSVLLLSATASAQHVHGVIDLGVVVEDNTLAVSLDAPLSDVVGFEHAPSDDAQRSALERAARILARADAMFGVPASAGCSVSETTIEAPEYLETLLSSDSRTDAGHPHDDHDEHDHSDHEHDDHDDHDHSDHEHDHDNHAHSEHEHDHDDHKDHDHTGHDDHDHAAEHSDLTATYQWTCSDPSQLDTLALSFVSGFTSVETIRVQLLTADGVQLMSLTASDDSLPLMQR